MPNAEPNLAGELDVRRAALAREIERLEVECAQLRTAVEKRDGAAMARKLETRAGAVVGFLVGAAVGSFVFMSRFK